MEWLAKVNQVLNTDIWLFGANEKISKLFEQAKYAEAETYLRSLTSKYPQYAGLHQCLGMAYLCQGKGEVAVKSVLRAVELYPNPDFKTYYALARAYHTARRHNEALIAIQAAIDLAPNQSMSYWVHGEILSSMNRDAEAMVVFEHAISINPRQLPTYEYLFYAQCRLQRFDDAIELMKQCREMWPQPKFALPNLVLAYFYKGDVQLANLEIENVFAVDPLPKKFLDSMANQLFVNQFYSASAGLWQQLLDLDLNAVSSNVNFGLSLQRGGRFEEARLRAQMVLDDVASEPIDRGIAFNVLDSHQEAIESYLIAKEQGFGLRCPGILENNIGYSYEHLKKWERALAYFRLSVELDPRAVNPWRGIGFSNLALGRLEEAEDAFRLALKMNPRWTEARLGLGRLEYLRGNLALAIEHIQQGLELEPSHQESKDELTRLTGG